MDGGGKAVLVNIGYARLRGEFNSKKCVLIDFYQIGMFRASKNQKLPELIDQFHETVIESTLFFAS